MFGRTPILVLCLLVPAACFGPRSVEVEHATWRTADGVIVRDLFAGLGPGASAGETIAIDYTGWLEDGTEIDSTKNWGRPVEFVLGEAPLAGWNQGLQGIAIGGRRRLILPPETAYGQAGIPGLVPPGATLVFEVERVERPEPETASPPPAEAESEAQRGGTQSAGGP